MDVEFVIKDANGRISSVTVMSLVYIDELPKVSLIVRIIVKIPEVVN